MQPKMWLQLKVDPHILLRKGLLNKGAHKEKCHEAQSLQRLERGWSKCIPAADVADVDAAAVDVHAAAAAAVDTDAAAVAADVDADAAAVAMNPLNTQRTHCIEYVGEFYAGAVLRLAVKLCHVKCTVGWAMQMNLVVKFMGSQALKLPSMHLLGSSSICKKEINLYDMGLTCFECLPLLVVIIKMLIAECSLIFIVCILWCCVDVEFSSKIMIETLMLASFHFFISDIWTVLNDLNEATT